MQSNPSPRGDIHAWVLGSGVPSLAAAVFLIEEAKIPPDRVHILEAVSKAGGSTVNTGDPVNGYEYRTGALSTFNDVYVEKLLSMVPSQNEPGKTALDDILEFNEAQPVVETPHTRFLVEKSNGISTVGPKYVGLGLRDRIDMFKFVAKTEKSLGRSRIQEYFHESFFRSNYWLVFATT